MTRPPLATTPPKGARCARCGTRLRGRVIPTRTPNPHADIYELVCFPCWATHITHTVEDRPWP